jgi:hypothetical protein
MIIDFDFFAVKRDFRILRFTAFFLGSNRNLEDENQDPPGDAQNDSIVGFFC